MHHIHPRTTPTNTSDRSVCRFGDMCKSARCPWCHPNHSGKTHSNAQGDHEVRAQQQPPNAAHAERAISEQAPPSLYEVPAYCTRAGAVHRTLGGAHHGGGNRAVTSQPRTGQSTSYGDVNSAYRGAGGWGRSGCANGAPRSTNTRGEEQQGTQDAGATTGGTRASTTDKKEGRTKAGEATKTGNQNGGDGRACAWEAATTKGMACHPAPSLPGARATRAQPTSGGGCLPQPRWAVCATGAGAH